VVGREGRGRWLPRTSAGLEASKASRPAPIPEVLAPVAKSRAASPAGAR